MKNILVIEDEAILALDIKEKLIKLNYEVSEIFHYAEEAISWLELNTTDLILLDINLAGEMNGIEFAEIVKSKYDIPIIYTTAYADNDTLNKAKVTEPYSYIIKPYDLKDLESSISITLYRKETENKIKEINRAKEKLFSVITHDLKSALSGFMKLSELLSEEFEKLTIDEMQETAEAMHKSSSGLYKMLENLLEWSKIQTGNMNYSPEKFNLIEIFDDCCNIFSPMLKEKDLSFNQDINPDLKIKADKNMLEIILRNIVSNAIKFSKPGGNIEIKAEKFFKKCKISVSDEGIGIPEKIQNQLFGKNLKISRIGTKNEKGTGLGLMICKDLANKNDGDIRIESKENVGTTVYITLPLIQ